MRRASKSEGTVTRHSPATRLAVAAALACVLLTSRAADASYRPRTLAERVFGAEVVVVGTIDALRTEYYDLRVEEWLSGAPRSETLRVHRFVDWTCAQREPPYAVGQRLVAFLRSGERGLAEIGSGCEGEVDLENGTASLLFRPDGFDDDTQPLTEDRFRGALRAIFSGYREVGAPGYVDAWNRLLRHADPLVVATALERLDAEAEVNPGPASAFDVALVDVVARPERGLRLVAARRYERWLDPAQCAAAAKRLAQQARTGPAELRPAGVLGWIAAAPSDPDRRAAALELLADEGVPLAERDAVAEALASYGAPVPKGFDPAPIARVARETVLHLRDPALLLHVCGYLTQLHGGYVYPEPTDAEAERAKWLSRLAAAPAEQAVPPPRDPAPTDDRYLRPVDRAVFVPHDVQDRPFVARIVRAARHARNSDRAGDRAAALASYRDLCSAAVAVRDDVKRALLDLDVDLDALTKRARELAAGGD